MLSDGDEEAGNEPEQEQSHGALAAGDDSARPTIARSRKPARALCGDFCATCPKSCVKFSGAKAGLAFKLGDRGVGYYPDQVSVAAAQPAQHEYENRRCITRARNVLLLDLFILVEPESSEQNAESPQAPF